MGWGVKSSTIYGLTNFGRFIGSFKAFMTAWNYFNEDSPRCSAA